MTHTRRSAGNDPRLDVVQTYRPVAELVDPDWQHATVLANGIQQHYYRTGGSKPPLLLLHGFEENGLCWLRVASELAASYDVIMPDARGHGRSAGTQSGFSLALLAADSAALIQALELDRPVVLGRSMGATTAVQLAATSPDLVRAIVLEDPPMRPMPLPDPATNPGYHAWYQSWLAQMQTLKTQSHAERMVTALELLPGTSLWAEQDLVPWIEAQVQFDLGTIAHAFADTSLFASWRSLVGAVACPMLLMTGQPQHGSAATPEGIAQVQAAWQQGQHVAFANAGHLISRDAFEKYMAVVRDFLQQHR